MKFSIYLKTSPNLPLIFKYYSSPELILNYGRVVLFPRRVERNGVGSVGVRASGAIGEILGAAGVSSLKFADHQDSGIHYVIYF